MITAVIPPFTVAPLLLKQEFGRVEQSLEDLCSPYDKEELVFSLESVVGPVHTCLVLLVFPVFRCLLCIQLPAHLAALDFCHGGQGCSKVLGVSCSTLTQQPVT